MGLIDLFWNLSQDEALEQLEASIAKAHAASVTKAQGRDAAIIKQLQQENRELQIRVGVLIRLLIERGVFQPEEYAQMVNAAQARLSGKERH